MSVAQRARATAARATGARLGSCEGVPRPGVLFACWLIVCVAVGLVAGTVSVDGQPQSGEGGPFSLFWSWDWNWYRSVAINGYRESPGPEYAFFPLWPWLIRGFESLGPAWQLSGLLALASTAAAFAGFLRLAPGSRQRAALAFVCFPGTSLLLMAYPDALALAAAVWSLVIARRTVAGGALLAGVTALARPNGFLLAVQHLLRPTPGPLRSSLGLRVGPAVAACAAVAAVHLLFWRSSGTITAFTDAQEFWGRTGPAALGDYLSTFVGDPAPQPALMVALALCALVGCIVLWRMGGVHRAGAVYAFAVTGTTVLSGSLQSIPRHLVFAFPLIWILADGPARLRGPVVLALGAFTNAGLLAVVYRFPP